MTKGGKLPPYLQRIERHNAWFNKRLLVQQIIRLFILINFNAP